MADATEPDLLTNTDIEAMLQGRTPDAVGVWSSESDSDVHRDTMVLDFSAAGMRITIRAQDNQLVFEPVTELY